MENCFHYFGYFFLFHFLEIYNQCATEEITLAACERRLPPVREALYMLVPLVVYFFPVPVKLYTHKLGGFVFLFMFD